MGTMNVPREKYCETIEFIKKVAEYLKKGLAQWKWSCTIDLK